MIASNEDGSMYISRTPCGRRLIMKIGPVALWFSDEEFAALAGVVRKALDSQMNAFIKEVVDNEGATN